MPASFRFESSASPEFARSNNVVLAIDGSLKGRAHSSGYLTTTGFVGVVAAFYKPDLCQPQCSLATEMRAVYYGLTKITDPKVTLLTDNLTTALWLERWKAGNKTIPGWYNTTKRSDGNTPTIQKLRDIVLDREYDLTVIKVKGHSGDLLNEAADALAGIGSNVVNGIYDKASGQERVIRIANTFLDTYNSQQQQTAIKS